MTLHFGVLQCCEECAKWWCKSLGACILLHIRGTLNVVIGGPELEFPCLAIVDLCLGRVTQLVEAMHEGA